MVLVRPLSEDSIRESLQRVERALDEGVAMGDPRREHEQATRTAWNCIIQCPTRAYR